MVVVFLLAACATMPPGMKKEAAKSDSGEIVSSILKGVEDAGEKITLPSAPPLPPDSMQEEVAPPQEQLPQIKAAPRKRHAPKARLSSFKKKFKLTHIPPKKAAPKKNGGPAIGAKATAPEVAKPPMPMAAEPAPEYGVMAEVMRAPAAANGEEEYAVSMADR